MISFLTTTRMPKGMLNTSMFHHVRQREKHIIISDRSLSSACGRCFSTAPTMVLNYQYDRTNETHISWLPPTKSDVGTSEEETPTKNNNQTTTSNHRNQVYCVGVVPFEFTIYRYIRVIYPQIKNQTYTRISFFLFSE